MEENVGKAIIDLVYTNPDFDKVELRDMARQFGHATGTVLGVSIAGAIRDKQPYIDGNYIKLIRDIMIKSFNFGFDHAIDNGDKLDQGRIE